MVALLVAPRFSVRFLAKFANASIFVSKEALPPLNSKIWAFEKQLGRIAHFSFGLMVGIYQNVEFSNNIYLIVVQSFYDMLFLC